MSVQSTLPNQPETQISDSFTPEKIQKILEVALLTAQEPLPITELRKLFNHELSTAVLSKFLHRIREKWNDSGIELVTVASGWRFQSSTDMQPYLDRLTPPKTPRYSRAVLETLAIIAYRQPVTRGDIEEIRGVSVSSTVLKTLTTRGWIETVGHRNAPGKPALFATTEHFLNALNLRTLDELPPLEEMKSLVESGGESQQLPLQQPAAPDY